MSATELPVPYPPDTVWDEGQRTFYIILGVFLPLATICLALRFYVRHMKKNHYWWDDWLAALSWALFAVFMGLRIWAAKNGAALDLTRLPLERLRVQVMVLYVGVPIIATGVTTAKFSILALYLRIFKSYRNFRIQVWILSALCLGWWIAAVLVGIFQCQPIEAGWNPLIVDRKCINFIQFNLWIEVTNGVLDFAIAFIAIYVLRGLQLSRAAKWGVGFIFMLGALVAVIGAVRVGYTYQPETYSAQDQTEWVTVQNAFWVICCCILTFRPLLPRLRLPVDTVWSFFRSLSGSSNPSNGTRTSGRSRRSNRSGGNNAAAGADQDDIENLHSPRVRKDVSSERSGSTERVKPWEQEGTVTTAAEGSRTGSNGGVEEYPMNRIYVKNTVDTREETV